MDDPHFLALLAEAHLLDGDLGACTAAVEEGVELGRRERAIYLEPELLRLGAAASADPGAAEAALRRAVASAREQGARSLELRALTDLVRLLAGRPAAAAGPRAALGALLRSFSEGRDTPDQRAAAAAVDAPAGQRAVAPR
jgi:adenylate cyclase